MRHSIPARDDPGKNHKLRDALDQLCRDLTAERFAVPTPEWHRPAVDVEAEAAALRLIVDNERKVG